MNSFDLLKLIHASGSAKEILDGFQTQSEKGNIYEKLWDLVIKFGCSADYSNDRFSHYEGNINFCRTKEVTNLQVYVKQTKVFSKNAGGSSDITIRARNSGKWIFFSSKFYLDDSHKSIKDYEVQDIMAVIKTHDYLYHDYHICLLVNDKNKVRKVISSSQMTNNHLATNIIDIHDLSDLEKGYLLLKGELEYINYDLNRINTRFCDERQLLKPRFHQKLFIHKTMSMIEEGQRNFLWGWKCRAGKTYGVGGLLIEYLRKYQSCNSLIITPVPTETMPQFTTDLFHKFRDFSQFEIHEIRSGNQFKQIKLETINNIIVVSKQLLESFINENKADLGHLDLIIFDENHFGGTTEISNQIIESYASDKTIKLYLTATYQKTLNKWCIPDECKNLWDIEDEQFCKQRNVTQLVKKHGDEVLQFIDQGNEALSIYDLMPDMYILTTMMDSERYDEIKDKIKDTKYGFSMDSLFSISQSGKQFNYPDEVEKVLRFITGSNRIEDYPDGDRSIYGRIRKLSAKKDSRTDLSNGNFTSQLWFLPFGINMRIDKVSECLMAKMKANRLLKNYEIMIINSKKDYKLNDLKSEINRREIKAKEEGKTGLILLAGNQCSLGITLPLVDIVILLNNTQSSDRILQMMYRCMSESPNGQKKIGYVVDLNISRVLNTILDYNVSDKNLSIEAQIQYIIENNLLNIDSDHFEGKQNRSELVERLMRIWRSDPINNFKRLLRKIEAESIELEGVDQTLLNRYFAMSSNDSHQLQIEFDQEVDQELPSGKTIEKSSTISTGSSDDESEEQIIKISFNRDILPFLIPLACILTIDKRDQSDLKQMLLTIRQSGELLEIFNQQTLIWWNRINILDLILRLLNKYVSKKSNIYSIAVQIKMSIVGSIDQPDKLLEFIDSCMKPKTIEKRKFGEVFTPIKTINQMLDDLDEYYQKTNHGVSIFSRPNLTWFDPANGMGNYPVIIYLRLMDGLKSSIPEVEERKKHILEKMLYMAELNQKNVFVSQKIFNLNGEYQLNLYHGDSLELDIQEVFKVNSFDVVIGNPPYNTELVTKRGSAPPLYNKFIEKYIDKARYMSFIVPSRWFSGGKGLDKFREMMLKRTDLVYIKHFEDACQIFGNKVEIKGGVNYFLKSYDYEGGCKFNDSFLELNRYDIFVDQVYYTIIDKISSNISLSDIFMGQSYSGINSNDKKLVDDQLDRSYVKCYVSKMKGFEKYIKLSDIPRERDFSKWKVITARAAHKGNSGFGNFFIGKPNEVCNQSYVLFELDTEEEAKSLFSYLKCKLPNFMLFLRKTAQDISKNTVKWIPLPPLDREWNDQSVYQYFSLTEAEISIIRDTKVAGYQDLPPIREKIKLKPKIKHEIKLKPKEKIKLKPKREKEG